MARTPLADRLQKMRQYASDKLLKKMKPGKVYSLKQLGQLSVNASHDVTSLVTQNKILKVSPGKYVRQKIGRFGPLLPRNEELVRGFLNDSDFLLVDENLYSSLLPGLTQLSLTPKVLNRRRSGVFLLAGMPFKFIIARNYPKKISLEFLIVNLLDSVNNEDSGRCIKEALEKKDFKFEERKLLKEARKYGKRTTQRYLKKLLENVSV